MSRSSVIALSLIVLAFAAISAWKTLQHSDASKSAASNEPAVAELTARQETAAFWRIYREATDHRMAGRREEAAAAYGRALALDAHHQDALYYHGNMLADLGRFEEARGSWERLVAANPSSARGHARLGDLFFCVGDAYHVDLDQAEAAYLLAHEINKEETGHLFRLGEVALAAGRRPDARAYFNDVLASNTASMDAAFFLAYLDRISGREHEIISSLARGRTEGRATPEGMTGEGDTRSAEPQFERAGCSDLREIIAGLESVPQPQLRDEAERRFRLLDQWLEQRRPARASKDADSAQGAARAGAG